MTEVQQQNSLKTQKEKEELLQTLRGIWEAERKWRECPESKENLSRTNTPKPRGRSGSLGARYHKGCQSQGNSCAFRFLGLIPDSGITEHIEDPCWAGPAGRLTMAKSAL